MDFNMHYCFVLNRNTKQVISVASRYLSYLLSSLSLPGEIGPLARLKKRKHNVSIMLVKLECHELYRHLASKAEIPVHNLFSQKKSEAFRVIAAHM